MPYTAANHLGRLPNAAGTITRLAYAHAKANGIDTQALLKEANLTLQQINNTRLKLRVHDQIKFLNLVAGALQDDMFGFHLAERPDLREFGFLITSRPPQRRWAMHYTSSRAIARLPMKACR